MQSDFSLCGAVVADVETGLRIARVVKSHVDCLFVDCEKKIAPRNYGESDVGNLDKAIREAISEIPVLTYKGNDLTVDAIEQLCVRVLGEVSGQDIAVVGAGNIGSKIALRLVERGNHVRLFSRDAARVQTIVAAINDIRPSSTISMASAADSLSSCLRGSRVVIGSATTKGILGLSDLDELGCTREQALLIDVGKGIFREDVLACEDFVVHRLDAGDQMLSALSRMWLDWRKLDSALGTPRLRRSLNGLRLVRKGVAGARGEVVVDDVESPSQVLGVCDGAGGFDPTATIAVRHEMGL